MLASLLFIAAAQLSAPDAPAQPREIAPGVHLLPGAFQPGRGPDGNTVIFIGSVGLIVVDTGRHAWHSDAILAFAAARSAGIAAIVNTHWHLDHASGNGRVKAAHPNARVYATNAAARALGPGGFLTRNLDSARAMLAQEGVSGVQREEIQIFLDTMAASDALRPDVVVERAARLRLAGRPLDVRVAENAVTDADIWIYDRRTRVAVLGDLITLPAPFFETACPQAWRAALDAVWATPFQIAVPGHGEPMTRDQFDLYRRAYVSFIDCAASQAAAGECAAGWVANIGPFIQGDARAERAAPQMAEYYVGFLRENGGSSPDCLAR